MEGGTREAGPASTRRADRSGPEGQVEPSWFALGESPLALLLLRPLEAPHGPDDFVCADLTAAAERALGRPRHAFLGRRVGDALGHAWTARCADVWRSGQAQAFARVRVAHGAELRGVISRSGGALAIHFEATSAPRAWLAELAEETIVPLRGLAALSGASDEACSERHVREAMVVIEACAASLLCTLGDAADVEAIEAGGLARVRDAFAPREALAAALRPLGALARAKDLALDLLVDPAVPAALRGDADRLGRALACLVGEALHHTSRGGVQVRVELEGPALHLAVEDPGPAAREGAVGRRVAERVVALLGGRSWAVPLPGVGRIAHFTWPVEPCDEDMSDPPPRKLRVLLAEDDPLHQVIAVQALERAGHEVVVVDTGWRAIAAAAAGGFDLAVLGLGLPELADADALQLLRAGADARRLPVAAIVGRATPALRASCDADGFDAVLERPLDARALRTLLNLAARTG